MSCMGIAASPDAWTGHTENPGWKLDKWKFLPMVKRNARRISRLEMVRLRRGGFLYPLGIAITILEGFGS